ncbi:hypothetical protein ASPVEDRAFT_57649 [Aspergillus versicolor CBS 583.65]|uniref:FAD-binding PCMH-type domain-containing protein n=1 Tax=Aspergillus versicolor CBS 583.65 TaxID=1036611 RepID=A0A1L9Q4L3_ASPVE|nr:uncharacterized protein ASPVEDRAFT_57649 [Aspergillus versicolor CBS 583.65]OJJ08618.1 hypothetical protein ASPVEDRAFT_57649 [Aspergillus versicolor CBS 583.65]
MTRHFSWRASAAVALAVTPLVTADICSTLEAQGIEVERPLAIQYGSELNNYWSVACGDLRPTCIAYPSSSLEVSAAVKELHNTDGLFAVKSGGHMPNNGFASIQDGLLISTKNLDQVVYNPDDQTALIGPGLDWQDAQQGLDDVNSGRAVVGGRMGEVGVGGYMLGAGLSFLSSQYGWAANNVVNFEVVLANGTVVNANEEEHTDLFAALKGGGNNFGIVTSYKLKTHPISKVWGGNYVFTADKTPDVLQAVRDFTEYYPDDKAAVIVTADHAALIDTWIMFLFYDGPEPPKGVFDNFTALNPLDTTKTWDSFNDLLKNNNLFVLKGQRYVITTETTPLPAADVGAEVMQTLYDTWFNISNTVIDVPNVIASMALQPMSRTITEKARAKGGDLLNFPPGQDYLIFEFDFSYAVSASDNRIDAATKNLYSEMNIAISDLIEQGKLPDVYRPLFMNDAYRSQDYWGRIDPQSRELALKARKAYDPEKFFQTRTSGGFRLG